MKTTVYGLAFLVLASNTSAENLDNQPFADINECKTYYKNVKEEKIAKLRKKKKMMGPGMPTSVYSRKMQKIDSEYESNLASCEAIAKSWASIVWMNGVEVRKILQHPTSRLVWPDKN